MRSLLVDYTAGTDGGLGHITVPGAHDSVIAKAGATMDCIYSAVIEKLGLPESTTVASLRSQVAQRLVNDEACKLFYHNWTLEGSVKEFSGLPSTKTIGLNAAIMLGGGAAGGFGWYIDRETGEYGLYGTLGAGPGLDIGVGVSAQFYNSLAHLCGKSLNFDASYGFVSVSRTTSLCDTSISLGHGFNVNLSPLAFGGSMTAGETKILPLSPVLRPIFGPIKQYFSDLDKWVTRGVKDAYGLPL